VKRHAEFHEAEDEHEQHWKARCRLDQRRPGLASRRASASVLRRAQATAAPQQCSRKPGAASPCPIRLPPNCILEVHRYCSTSITDVPPSVNVFASPGQCTGGVAVALVSTWMNSSAWLPVPVHFAVACAWV